MKKIGFLVLLAAFCTSSIALANTDIQKKHKGLKKDGKMINCAYCHTTAKIEKKKGYGSPWSTRTLCAWAPVATR